MSLVNNYLFKFFFGPQCDYLYKFFPNIYKVTNVAKDFVSYNLKSRNINYG